MDQDRQWTDEELAKDWIQRFSSSRRQILSVENANGNDAASRRIDAETFWAFDVLHDLESRDPEHAWALILLVLRLAPEDEGVRDNLAAGPLEGLLARHGDTVIQWVEDEARRNPQVKDLLAGVWKSGISESVWQRLQRAGELI